jgi:hypothetical protein
VDGTLVTQDKLLTEAARQWRGTFEVFEAAVSVGIDQIIFISTTSVYRPDTLYARSKILAELIAEDYRKHCKMNVIALRPRGFIPFWDRDVYVKYSDWARWFWKGAVHIDDVAAAVILSLDLISRQQIEQQLILTLDSAYEYTDADLSHWDAEGAGSTFKKYYSEYYDLALSYGLDPALKPTRLDISETVRWLGYKPSSGWATNHPTVWRTYYRNWQPTAIVDRRKRSDGSSYRMLLTLIAAPQGGFAHDSALEGDGFEPSVPRKRNNFFGTSQHPGRPNRSQKELALSAAMTTPSLILTETRTVILVPHRT